MIYGSGISDGYCGGVHVCACVCMCVRVCARVGVYGGGVCVACPGACWWWCGGVVDMWEYVVSQHTGVT